MKRSAFYADLLERTCWTALQGFFAFWIVTGEVDTMTLKAAGVAAAIAAGKSLVAVNLPWTAPDSASTLPEAVDPPQE